MQTPIRAQVQINMTGWVENQSRFLETEIESSEQTVITSRDVHSLQSTSFTSKSLKQQH